MGDSDGFRSLEERGFVTLLATPAVWHYFVQSICGNCILPVWGHLNMDAFGILGFQGAREGYENGVVALDESPHDHCPGHLGLKCFPLYELEPF